MSLLFNLEGKVVSPNTETLLVPPFSEIWKRDKSKDKSIAIEELSYIEFMASAQKTNPYSGYSEEERPAKIMKDIISNKKWKPDTLVEEAIEKLKVFQEESSVTYNYYMSAKVAAEKMQKFFLSFDMNKVNPKTFAPIYKPKDITSALNDTSRVLENLNSLKEKVDNEIYEVTKNKGQKIISPFADPSTL